MSYKSIASPVNDRRSFLKMAAAAPLFASIGARSLASTIVSTRTRSFSSNLYTKLGVRPFINGRGTWTYLSGSLELPEVREAASEASHYFVDMFELQRAAGKRLAELSGAEYGMVTAGSAAAMSAATAGCMAGTNPKNVWALPDSTGLKNEVIMVEGRSEFDNAIRLVGAKLVLTKGMEGLHGAITSKTAMVYTTWRDERLQQALKVTKAAGVPLMLDDAAGIPPFENFTRYASMGIDLFCFSGGKGLRGPQASGLLLGRKDLIEAAMANCSPWEGAVCRPMKVGKEEIMGVLAAIEFWSKADLRALTREWQGRVERIQTLVRTVPGVTTSIAIPEDGNSYPTLTVTWDEKRFKMTVAECDHLLRVGEPRIEVLTNTNPSGVRDLIRKNEPGVQADHTPDQLQIISMTLQPGEDLIVGNRLRQILEGARSS